MTTPRWMDPSQTPSAPTAPSTPASPAAVAPSTQPPGQVTVAPGSAAPATPLPAESVKALQAALASEHAAIWCYGLVAAADKGDVKLINQMRSAHLIRRDAASQRLAEGQGQAEPPAAAYTLAAPPTNVGTARALAIQIESDCAAAWYALAGNTDDEQLRRVAGAALSDTAVRITQWKKISGINPITVPFPGQPG